MRTYSVLTVSKNITDNRKTKRLTLRGKLSDYKYRFRLYDDDGILYFSGVCTEEGIEDALDDHMSSYGVTRIDVKEIGSKDDYEIVIS